MDTQYNEIPYFIKGYYYDPKKKVYIIVYDTIFAEKPIEAISRIKDFYHKNLQILKINTYDELEAIDNEIISQNEELNMQNLLQFKIS